jgi:hypothetical protein
VWGSSVTDEPRTSFGARQRDSRGGCLRGLVWAVLLETAGVLVLTLTLAFLAYSWRALHL